MIDPHDEAWEMRVQDTAPQFEYPPTPDIARSVRRRLERQRVIMPRLIQVGAAALVILLVVTIMVPDLRARAFDWLGIGAVRIVKEEPPVDPAILPTDFDPAYLTTLESAQSQVDFTIPRLADPPEFVYLYPDDIVILVWDDFSLHLVDSSARITKFYSDEEIPTTVNGSLALWLVEPHAVRWPNDEERLIEANVLLWESQDITYRIETHLSMDEARLIAESIE